MKKICLRSAGVSRNKYLGAVEPYGVLPFRLNVGPDEIFEICHPDGSGRSAPLHHGETVSLGKGGAFLDANGMKLSASPSAFVVEKLDAQGRIGDGDRISLRSRSGWLASDCHGLNVKNSVDWHEVAFQIYEIPEFSRKSPITILHRGIETDTLGIGPHGRAAGGEARVHVSLDREAPPGGIIVAFRFDCPEHEHVYIPPILLDGVREGFSPIHFAQAHRISESGINLAISAEIPCTGESSMKFFGGADGLVSVGCAALSVHKSNHFEPEPTRSHERSGADRRTNDRRQHDRRGPDRRARKQGRNGFDNHFLEKWQSPGALYS